MDRREFLRIVLGGAALAALSSCAPSAATTPETTPSPNVPASDTPVPDTPRPTATFTPVPTVTPAPTAKPQLLRNENRPGFYIRYHKSFEPVDTATWQLSVEGRVRSPKRLNLADLQALPRAEQTSRLTCVEGWSVAAKWEGFYPQALIDMVMPYDGVGWVHFHCADGYYESLALEEFVLDRVLLAYGMNGDMLLPEYGAPLRVIVPFKYGYKGPKAITRIVFAGEELRGYWPTVGPYSTEGYIQPGVDYALDLESYRKVTGRGEVVYDDGIEAQDR